MSGEAIVILLVIAVFVVFFAAIKYFGEELF